jgi:hypothetical protein
VAIVRSIDHSIHGNLGACASLGGRFFFVPLTRWSKRRGKATHNCGCQQTMWLSSITSLVFLSMIVFANAQAPQRRSHGSLHKKAEKGFFLTSAWNWTCLSWSRPVRSVYVKIFSICCPLSRHFWSQTLILHTGFWSIWKCSPHVVFVVSIVCNWTWQMQLVKSF